MERALDHRALRRCPHCRREFADFEIHRHIEQCEWNLVLCEKCGKQVPFAGFSAHVRQCVAGEEGGQRDAAPQPAPSATSSSALSSLLRTAEQRITGTIKTEPVPHFMALQEPYAAVATRSPARDTLPCPRCQKLVVDIETHVCEATMVRCFQCLEMVDSRLMDRHWRVHEQEQLKLCEARQREAEAEKKAASAAGPSLDEVELAGNDSQVPNRQGNEPQSSSQIYSDGLLSLIKEYGSGSVLMDAKDLEAQKETVPTSLCAAPVRKGSEVMPTPEESQQMLIDAMIPPPDRAHLRLCVLCQGVIRKEDMMDHLAVCPKNLRSCEMCGKGVPISEYDDHLLTCPKNTRVCYVCGKSVHILALKMHVAVCNSNAREVVMFHGTSAEAAKSILQKGFRPSEKGLLGEGVYLSRDIEKASKYGSTIVESRVHIGKTLTVDKKGHYLQKNWAAHGYDSAWIPPNCGVTSMGLEEHCVRDARRVMPVKMFSSPNAHH